VDLLGSTTPGQKFWLDQAIKDSSNNVERYVQEKADIKN